MTTGRSYSITELSAATGFDRRTIVYYIQSGLLPKVGRRGPHTRYPAECLARLQFIRGVRRLQGEGQLLTATLAEIRHALATAAESRLRDLLDRDLPVDEVKALLTEQAPEDKPPPSITAPAAAPPAPPVRSLFHATTPSAGVRGPAGENRSYGLADAGIRKRASTEAAAPAPATPALATPADDAGDLGQLLRDLELRPAMNAIRNAPGAPEQWTEIPITTRVYLSVRGLSSEDAPLAEAVARCLKRALRIRPSAG